MSYKACKEQCRTLLHFPTGFLGKSINAGVAICIVLSIAVIPILFIPQLEWAYDGIHIFEMVISILFTLEYVLRAWSADRPIRYVFSWYGIIDLAAILPFYLGIFGFIPEHSYSLVFLRILRILKFGKIYCHERDALAHISRHNHGEFKTIPHEKIERIVQKHPMIFFISLVPPLIFVSLGLFVLLIFRADIIASAVAILFFSFSFLFFIKAWLDFQYDAIYITNYRIIFQNRQLFGTRLNEMIYESITNIRPDNTGVMHFLFGYGNIHIETAAATGNQEFLDASDPHLVVEHISQNRQKIVGDQHSRESTIHTDNSLQEISVSKNDALYTDEYVISSSRG